MPFQLTGTRFKAFTDAGFPLVGGRVYTTASGTTTQKVVYSDATLTSSPAYTNDGTGALYITLDARGECDMWLGTGSYTIRYTTAAGVTIDTVDGISDPQSAVSAELSSVAAGKGADMVGFAQASGVSRTVSSKLRETISVKDFGAVGDGVADDTAKIQAALNAAGIGREVFVPKGRYKVSSTLVIPQSTKMVGESSAASFKSGLFANLSTLDVYTGQGGTATPAVLLDLGSGVHGMCFNWPNQVGPSAAAPVQFGWAIATDTSKAYMIDDVTIRDVSFVNAYMGISLDKAGRFSISHVYGDCIKEGLFVDRCYDTCRADHVHFWTFTYIPGDAMMTWISNNGRAFNFGRVDQVVSLDLFQYGRNVGFDFNDNGFGGCWGDFVGCFSDVSHMPMRVTKAARIKWLGGSLIPYLSSEMCVTTSLDASVASQGPVQAAFVATQFHDTARIAAVISSSTGSFTFSDCDFERQEVAVINEGAANVSVSNPKTRFGTNSRLTVLGNGLNTSFNGVPNPTLSTDVTPSNFGMNVFTGGVPNGWGFIAGSAVNIANQGGSYVRLLYNSATSLSMSYILPTEITDRKSLYTVRVNVRFYGISDGRLTIYSRRSDTTNIQSYRRFDSANHGTAIWYDIPIIVGHETSARSIDIEWSAASGAGAGYVEIAGLTLWECADSRMQQDVIDSIYRREFLDPLGYGPAISRRCGNREVSAAAAPTSGTWRLGDRVIRLPQIVGQPKAWVCTVSGTPGTWSSEGNL